MGDDQMSQVGMRDVRGLYWEWIVANSVAEAAGLGTTVVLGTVLAPALARASSGVEILGGAAMAVVLGTFLEGAVVGVAQGHVLARHSSIRLADWTWASALGAGLAWVLGMTPSTVVALLAGDAPAASAPLMAEPGPMVTLVLAVGLGVITGPILGAVQWRVLRRTVPDAGRWLWANAAAWAVGMPVIFAGMDLVPWSGPPLLRILAIYLMCAVAGMVVGVIHGRVLVDLLTRSTKASNRTSSAPVKVSSDSRVWPS
jgi:hypothetical protein